MTVTESRQRCEQCGATIGELDPAPDCPSCHGLLELVHPPVNADGPTLRARFAGRRSALHGPDASGVWRYRDLVLPSVTTESIVSHPEGNTPLLSRERVSAWSGLEHLLIKHEGHNPRARSRIAA